MIQDIEPHQFRNEYRPKPPERAVIFYIIEKSRC